MNNQKIPLKSLDTTDLEVLNEATHYYAAHLIELINNDQKIQACVHYSILSKYGHEVFKKLSAPHKPEKSSMQLEVFMAYVASDSLHYYQQETSNSLHRSKCAGLIEQIDPFLPLTSKKFAVDSNLNN
ncbi:hypothetical protein JM79_3205 [Gramella sp. Hel_I_59]|uniref:hypothetical protein n=1 Tax=Gramella sp. Hel_I_59 TaxID=1249978 RepID=UPI001153F8D6|nr:hypothetical protein [Gramella sp. Hel_I_59]TQI72248.1 hypothetical protein JM79_3205 [Gramella sp. Hel_I_59]